MIDEPYVDSVEEDAEGMSKPGAVVVSSGTVKFMTEEMTVPSIAAAVEFTTGAVTMGEDDTEVPGTGKIETG